MPFPSHGCRTCKRRRVKCDETRPICNRCRKADLTCDNVEEGNFIFLNENEFVVGRRKRPRGPNVSARMVSPAGNGAPNSSPSEMTDRGITAQALQSRQHMPRSSVSQTLGTPIDEQALNYYYRSYLEMEHLLPDIADSHLKYVTVSRCFAEPQSILSLAIFAVSHATFGRALKSHASLNLGGKQYSKALVKTNLALQNASHATDDDVLLAIMLLSFYENSVMGKGTSTASSHAIQTWASRSFAHHDGALAVLKLRRQVPQRCSSALVLDKLVRRQLTRSLLLRSIPLPPWLEDGSEYGEHGSALELDICLAEVAKLRARAQSIFTGFQISLSDGCDKQAIMHQLLKEAHTADRALLSWTDNVPLENWYSTHTVKDDGHDVTNCGVFGNVVHIYPTVGHAGMWNRYRALRLGVNDIILQALSTLAGMTDSDGATESLEEAVNLTIQHLSDDLCASVPYMFGRVRPGSVIGNEVTIIARPAHSKPPVKATTAALLCWPLATAAMVSGIPKKHVQYLTNSLLEVSQIVDDGVLERLAVFFPKLSKSSAIHDN
ncbi:hypothetical protein AJ78_04243 [Emergomyces pasteurianus Ep9510]|uniref:Zn(2)-C6 fungal-type domain-containing protein n=1 Tax=Emergomyces pasteurianus Ep9510 TaxID=1447872 RepID=A0A1J9PGG2_9EURO|nr:hypothetical protein AJ78_04243 [Emergomyces pasteurianus Ep9510]